MGALANGEDWQRHFDALSALGDGAPPGGRVAGDLRVGRWVQAQRVAFRQGRLSAERACALETLPGWTWNAKKAICERAYQVLVDRTDGAPGRDVVVDGFCVGYWVMDQRRLHRNGRLPDERVSALESVPGWTWDASSGTSTGRARST